MYHVTFAFPVAEPNELITVLSNRRMNGYLKRCLVCMYDVRNIRTVNFSVQPLSYLCNSALSFVSSEVSPYIYHMQVIIIVTRGFLALMRHSGSWPLCTTFSGEVESGAVGGMVDPDQCVCDAMMMRQANKKKILLLHMWCFGMNQIASYSSESNCNVTFPATWGT
jgi:hypothetical protein